MNVTGRGGVGKTSLIESVFGSEWTVFRPSDVLRENADRLGVTLSSRADYAKVHDTLSREHPNFMVDEITRLRGKVVLDGLRVYSHAEKLQEIVGPNKYFTTVLTCPDEMRLDRLKRRSRPDSTPKTIEDMNTQDQSELGEHFGFERVIAMANLPQGTFDTSGSLNEVAFKYDLIVRAAISTS